ncbi:hypothetical protein DOTSEDRAFT_33122 [Dothistroma septosporum NZE10]|uniref:Uncharacterized protein n=1 Tax=Dothistroma septosporum (strain NZE10 / CBS 128990) TaxID=675120 RepID=N1PUA9_DOTSN|nr:hypothetical protein DOTSEDRAFT_33122 [Dothistroma septosporum NZE10]
MLDGRSSSSSELPPRKRGSLNEDKPLSWTVRGLSVAATASSYRPHPHDLCASTLLEHGRLRDEFVEFRSRHKPSQNLEFAPTRLAQDHTSLCHHGYSIVGSQVMQLVTPF